LISIHF